MSTSFVRIHPAQLLDVKRISFSIAIRSIGKKVSSWWGCCVRIYKPTIFIANQRFLLKIIKPVLICKNKSTSTILYVFDVCLKRESQAKNDGC